MQRTSLPYLISLCGLLVLPTILASQITYVDLNSTCTAACGGSWAEAYPSLQDALTNTTSGQIWVARGTYRSTDCNPCTDTDKESAFRIPPGVQLYGGFAGTEGALSERDWETNPTILSGDTGVRGDSSDNVYRVLIAENSLTTTILDGFIIEEGNADGSFGFSAGGGLYIDANPGGTGNIKVRNCTFRNNYGGGGGAIAIDCVLGGVSEAEIRNCIFTGNTASLRVTSTGAAIFVQGNSGAQIRPRIVGCTFEDNFCGNDGGAISATPTGAGTLLAMLVDSCVFRRNEASDRGGAIWYRMSSDGESRVVIRNSHFSSNVSGGQGGAIFARSSFGNTANDTILNCLFSQNQATGLNTLNEGEGGAIFLRGSQEGSRNQVVANCVFDRNYAEQRGGGLATTSNVSAPGSCRSSLVNCTFFGNATNGSGGAVHAEGSEGTNTLSAQNSIFWQNTAALESSELHTNGAAVETTYCNISAGVPAGVSDGGNNGDLDPSFADASGGDLHLTACSPLVDAGNNDFITPISSTDLDGDQRIFNGIVDLGAYELGVIYVDQAASGANTGRSWADAYPDLRTALAAAKAGDQVWVADGTYRPSDCNPCSEADKEARFYLPPNVEVYGGFSGNESRLTERDWASNRAILSGDIGVPGDSLDNVFRVLVAENSTDKTILDGFIIEEGNADGSFGFSAGGGLLIDANPGGTGNIKVRNCTFRNNYGGGGGAIAIDCVLGGVSEAEIRNCTFTGNTASLRVSSTGAAIFMQGNSGAQVRPRIVGCTFEDNFCGNDGGAISATPTGAGTLLAMLVDSCVFRRNEASDRGGAIWYRMSSDGESQVVIRNSHFSSNVSGGQGGAIFARSSFGNTANDTILNCLFSQNRATGLNDLNDGEGGAIFLRGSQDGTRNQHIINCAFDRNYALDRGGALATTSFSAAAGTCHAWLSSCSFSDNITDGDGATIHALGSEGVNTLEISNSIIWGDRTDETEQEIVNEGATISLTHTDITGGVPAGVNDNGNNLAVDPQYLDATSGDLRLSACSPVLDIGDQTALPLDVTDLDEDGNSTEILPLDLAGQARVFNGALDLGAYEWNEDPPAISLQLTTEAVSCANACDGLATAIVSGGVPGYRFAWSDGQSTATARDLCAGTYFVTVSDAASCVLTDSVRIIENPPLTLTVSPDTTICAGDTITLLATASGGTEPLTYRWDNGLAEDPQPAASPTNTTSYQLVVTDENGCTATDSIAVTVLPNPNPNILGPLSFCPGASTTLDAGDFNTYLWSTGDTSRTILVDMPDTYAVTVSDASGCSGEASVMVTQNENLEVNISGTLSFCPGASTTLNAGDFNTYLWSTGDTSRTILVDMPDTYAVTVSDASGCSGEDSVSVTQNDNLDVNISGQLSFCPGASTTLNAGDFNTYLWSTGDTSRTILIEMPGTYAVSVSDASGCSGEDSVSVTQNDNLDVNISGQLSFCPGASTTLDAGDFNTYLWSTGDTSRTILIEMPGTYAVSVSDASGCSGEDSVSVTQNDNLDVNISGTLSFCPGASTTLDAGDFATYLWSNGDTSRTILVDMPDTYAVTVSDASGCSGEDSVSVTQNDNLDVNISGPLSFCPGASTTLDAGDFATYLWSTGDTSRTILIEMPGTYAVTVSDASGCSGEDSVSVTQNDNLDVNISGTLSFCPGASTTLDAGDFATYLWSNGDTSRTILVDTPDTYTVTVSDGSGCSEEDAVAVRSVSPPQAIIQPEDRSLCVGESVELMVSNTMVVGWLDDSGTIVDLGNGVAAVSPAQSTIYRVVVANECFTDTLSVATEVFANPVVDAGADQTLNLGVSVSLQASGAAQYTWSPAVFLSCANCPDPLAEPDTTTTLFLSGVDNNGCVGVDSVLLEVLPAAEQAFELANGITPNGDGQNDELIFEVLVQGPAEAFPDNELIVFNRWGDIVYQAKPYFNNWEGENQQGQALPEATYYYVLRLNIDEGVIYRGDITIIR